MAKNKGDRIAEEKTNEQKHRLKITLKFELIGLIILGLSSHRHC